MNVMQLLEEWQVLGHAACLVAASIEHALNEYCAGIGPAPHPPLVACHKHLSGQSTELLGLIWAELKRARAGAAQI